MPSSSPLPLRRPAARIGYFGGSFDPPHRGHLTVALAACDRFRLDRVLLAPTARQPLKPHGSVASFADRLQMTELLCQGHPPLEASAIDGPRPHGEPNYTADTLRRLRQELAIAPPAHRPAEPAAATAPMPPPAPDAQIFAILGADAFLTLPQWREPDALFQLADWIVVSRPGFNLPDLARLGLTAAQQARVHLLPGIANPVSATNLRARLHAGQDCHELIPSPVLAWIHHSPLYK
jgi:nicotinate-nucleotide adenylyltransferase